MRRFHAIYGNRSRWKAIVQDMTEMGKCCSKQMNIISKHPKAWNVFLERLKALISLFVKTKVRAAFPISYVHEAFVLYVFCQTSKFPFRFFYMFQTCLPSHSCNYRQWKPALPKIYMMCLHTWKLKKSHKDTQVRSSDPSTLHVARLRHPPKRVTGSNSRSSRPQRSEPEKKIRLARKRGKLLRRWGSVVMGQVGPNVQMNVKM